jgi:hypothetical protein
LVDPETVRLKLREIDRRLDRLRRVERIHSRRSWTRLIGAPVGAEPTEPAGSPTLKGPTELVNELVMKRAYEHEVLELGLASVTAPYDVMGLSEPASSAPWEPAFTVPVPELAHHL